jgi:hypothetical protein
MRRPSLGSVFLSVLVLCAGCRRATVTEPEAPPASGSREGGRATASAATEDGGNQLPTAVFRTRPRPDAAGVISGGSSFEVTYNLCHSTDPDPGDELRFTFDFDGDGTVDERGSCRATHRYEVGTYETGCQTTRACVSDRQPEHVVCQAFPVCAIGRRPDPPAPDVSPTPEPTPTPGPTPTPTPTPDPDRFVEQTIEGDLSPIAARDAWAFEADAATEVFFALDTVSSESAYLMQACVSTSPRVRDCLRPLSHDRPSCAYPPPGGLGCPRRTTVLPRRGVYYLVVAGFRFTRTPGAYTVFVRAHPAIGRLTLAVNNGDHPASVEP